MKQVEKITFRTQMGHRYIADPYFDKVVITDHNFHYEVKPRDGLGEKKPISWTAKSFNPEYTILFNQLSEMAKAKYESAKDFEVWDEDRITLVIVFSNKTRIERTFYVPISDFEPCFRIVRQMALLLLTSYNGILAAEYFR